MWIFRSCPVAPLAVHGRLLPSPLSHDGQCSAPHALPATALISAYPLHHIELFVIAALVDPAPPPPPLSVTDNVPLSPGLRGDLRVPWSGLARCGMQACRRERVRPPGVSGPWRGQVASGGSEEEEAPPTVWQGRRARSYPPALHLPTTAGGPVWSDWSRVFV